jgi:hypothetical protein
MFIVPIIFAAFFRLPLDQYEIWIVRTKALEKNKPLIITAAPCQNVTELDRAESEQLEAIDHELKQIVNENVNKLEDVVEETAQQINMFAQLSE